VAIMTTTETGATAAAPASPARRRATVALLKDHQRRLRQGHPWAYSNEVHMEAHLKALPRGSIVRLTDAGGTPLGTATFNPHALVAVRMLTTDPTAAIDRAFLAGRLAKAAALRARLWDGPFHRLVHAEADRLPGLVVDRYGDVVVAQLNAAWIDALADDLVDAIRDTLAPRAVVLRRDSPARQQEGIEAGDVTVAHGTVDGPVAIDENGARFLADVVGGQKTGWFFDQRDNRAFVAGFARDARVLDLYTYGGGFGVLAAMRGAAQVTLVDRSAPALDLATGAAALNGVADRVATRKGDVFDVLEALVAEGARFDVVIGDPPAFVKSKKDLAAGAKGYRKLTRLMAQVTAPGGILFAASCSHNVDVPAFAAEVARGLSEASRTGRVLRTSGAAADHPVHPNLPESAYLKAQTLQVD
jgi:23S rRNA (cytosine1962-C5)-methyltransferase